MDAPHTAATQEVAYLKRVPRGAHLRAERTPSVRGWLARTTRNFALQDHVMLSYHAYLWVLAASMTRGPLAAEALGSFSLLLAWVLCTLALTRGELLPSGTARAVVYRVGMFGGIVAPYFVLRPLLHSLDPHVLDGDLLALDRALFGLTPSEWLDAYVNPHSVEWFSFFYYSYYALLAAILCGSLLFDSGRRHYEIMLATVIVIAVGHIGYTWVPGLGPHAWPALTFKHALVGGPWWDRVREAVSAAGAQLDIFPSLHTGLSMTVGLHVLRYRRQKPFTFVWPITIFFVANIIIATVFLRWHYGLDLIAGALLALVAQRIAIVAYGREENREHTEHDARQPLWERMVRR